MTVANDIYSPAVKRGLKLRMRPDLLIRSQQVAGRDCWVVKDPVALKYFHLRQQEHAILQMLDGRTSLEEIKRRFERAFAPLRMSLEQLQAFLGWLHGSGLVVSDAPGQGDELKSRGDRQRRLARAQAAIGVLAIRFPGIDPQGLLRRLYPACGWMLSRWFLAGCLVAAVCALLLVAVQFDSLQARLPDFETFFTGHNVVWLAITLIGVKVLHELGHALACRHFDVECREMGIMLLVFTPCLYCNVSDAWMLPNKWHRMAISAAGMGVEIVLASVCTFLWWFSEAGLLNTLCLNVMFICSVSTILFNGNPLLRYDGYYILSDLVDVPNLAQQSKALLSRGLGRLLLGIEFPEDRSLPERHRGLLALYGLASTLYRWGVVVAILWFCHKVLQLYRLEVLATALAVMVVAGLLIGPVVGGVRFFGTPGWRGRIRPRRAVVAFAGLAAVIAGVGLVPLPYRVAAPARLQLEDGHRVYVSVSGRLLESVAAGEAVRRGETLAELENLDVRRRVEELIGQRNQQRLQLKNLQLRLAEDTSAGSQIPAAKEALADIEQRLAERQRDQSRLILKAPVDGTVLPPPRIPSPPHAPGRLSQWQGNPLEPRNQGCHLTTGTLFCQVGDPARLDTVLVIEQSELKFVRAGQRVRIQFDQLPGEILQGTIGEISQTELKVVPRELATGEDVPVRVGPRGLPLPAETSYQARVQLDRHDQTLLVGARGRAKILAEAQPLFRRVYRYLRGTFSITLWQTAAK